MPLQWRNSIWQSLEEGAGKRCSECAVASVGNGRIRAAIFMWRLGCLNIEINETGGIVRFSLHTCRNCQCRHRLGDRRDNGGYLLPMYTVRALVLITHVAINVLLGAAPRYCLVTEHSTGAEKNRKQKDRKTEKTLNTFGENRL